MSSIWEQVKFWLLWVLVNTFALGASFAALGSVDGEQHPPNWGYTFEFRYPDFPMSIISGCFLGLMQWILLNFYFRQSLIQWAAGSTVGMILMARISCLGYELYAFANFNRLTSGSEDLIFSIQNGAVSGFIGGLIGGCIQGCTLRHNIAWILTNAVAWAVAWGMGEQFVTLMVCGGIGRWSGFPCLSS